MDGGAMKAGFRIKGCDSSSLMEAARLSREVFRSDFFLESTVKEESYKRSHTRLLYEPGGKLASMLSYLPRKMNICGQMAAIAGINGVATAPEFRARGYAAELMKDAILTMEKQGFALSVLYPFKSEYYAALGYSDFTVLPKAIDAKKDTVNRSYSIKDISDTPPVIELSYVYNSFNGKLTCAIRRSIRYWKDFFSFFNTTAGKEEWDGLAILGAYSGGKLSAYAMISRLKNSFEEKAHGLKICEYACLSGEEEALNVLAERAASMALEYKFKKIFYEEAGKSVLRSGRELKHGELREYSNPKYIKMFRIINFRELMKIILPLAGQRLVRGGIKGGISGWFSISRSVTDFRGRIFFSFRRSGSTVEMDDGEFIKLFMGLCAFEGIKADGKNGLSKEELALMRLAFPGLKPVYWDFDYL
jgi:GNAT superfamily N-acetyltransferase